MFRLDEHRYALPLPAAERVIRAVEVTPLPKAPAVVIGVIDVHGRVLPVFNLRRRFSMPEREVDPADWFLIAHTTRGAVVLMIDEAEGVVEAPADDTVDSIPIVPGFAQFPGVARLDDGLVVIHDLEQFLSSTELRQLDDAMDELRDT